MPRSSHPYRDERVLGHPWRNSPVRSDPISDLQLERGCRAPPRCHTHSMQSAHPDAELHDTTILDQFTRQAEPFAQRHGYSNDPILDLMAECAAVQPNQAVLDVACGPGIISCFFAKRAARHRPRLRSRHARPRAPLSGRAAGRERRLAATRLFHRSPVCRQYLRLCDHTLFVPPLVRAAGRTARNEARREAWRHRDRCDVAPSSATQAAFNHWEILRDPSHTRALTLAELEALGDPPACAPRQRTLPPRPRPRGLLSGSFPNHGDADRIRALFEADIRAGTDTLGVGARREHGALRLTYPMIVPAWRKPT